MLPFRDRRGTAGRPAPWRYAAFLVVTVAAWLLPLLPHGYSIDAAWYGAAWGLLAASVLLTACGELAGRRGAAARGRPGLDVQLLTAAGPLLLFVAIHALRCSDGNYQSGYAALVVIPIAWLALYGRLWQVVAGVVATGLVVVLPIFVVGAPQYPPAGLRGELLIVILAAVIGPIMNRLVVGGRTVSTSLVRREGDFRAAFENAPIGMAITGMVGDRAGYFLRVNRALTQMLGRSAEELTSRPLIDFTHPEDVPLTFRTLDNLPGADTGRYQKRFVHASGRPFWASISYSVVRDLDGNPLHVVSQIENISERRESERALLEAVEADRTATERMRMIERARADMASAVSHELRTPLTSAQGYLELVLEGDAGPLTDEQRSMLEISFRSLARMNDLVADILRAASLEGQQLPPTGAVADLGEVVDNAVSDIRLQVAARGQTLRIDNGLHGVRVAGDAGRLERVVLNLLTNASKFTDDDGTITLATERGRDERYRPTAVISVTDTGVGISETDQARIFERFYRGDRTGVGAVVDGSGLGLAIVQAITTQAGGTVTVDSELGRGSTFTLTFPLIESRDRGGVIETAE